MAGLFGPSTAEIQQQISAQGNVDDFAKANLSPGRGQVAAASQAGRLLGRGLFGASDPRVQRAGLLQQAKQEVMSSGVELNSPEFFQVTQQALQSRGLMDEAMAVSEHAAQKAADSEPVWKNVSGVGLFRIVDGKATLVHPAPEAAAPTSEGERSLAKFAQISQIPEDERTPEEQVYYQALKQNFGAAASEAEWKHVSGVGLYRIMDGKATLVHRAPDKAAGTSKEERMIARLVELSALDALTSGQENEKRLLEAQLAKKTGTSVTIEGDGTGVSTELLKAMAKDQRQPVYNDEGKIVGFTAAPGGTGDLEVIADEAAAKLTAEAEVRRLNDLRVAMPKAVASMARLLVNSKASRVNIDLAINFLKDNGGAGLASLLKDVPGSDANELKNLLLPVQSRASLQELEDMRNNNKTGGAMGNLSNAEGVRLESALKSISQARYGPRLIQALLDYKAMLAGQEGRIRHAFNIEFAPISGDATLVNPLIDEEPAPANEVRYDDDGMRIDANGKRI